MNETRRGQITRGPVLYAAIGGLFGVIGFLDSTTPLGVVVWLLYLLPIWFLSRMVPFDARLVFGGAAVTTSLITVMFAVSSAGGQSWMSALNRGMGITLIWIVSLLLVRARRQEIALANSEEQFRLNFELAAVGQAQVSATTGRFIRVNDRFCEISGFPREDLLTMKPRDLTHPDDQAADEANLARLLRGETEEHHAEKRYLRPGGDVRWVRVSARLIRDRAGRPARTIAAVEDVTERKEAEAALMRLTLDLERRVLERTGALRDSQQRLRALTSELNLAEQRERRRLAGELHDYLAQLLVVARMKLSQTMKKLADPAPRQPLVEADEVLNRSLTYTRSLVAQLVPPVLQQFGLAAALGWLAEEMRRHELIVSVDAPQDRIPLSTDQEGLLFQSARELLMNVVKHAKTQRAQIGVEQADGQLTLTISDDGVGFDVESALEQATDKFGLFSIRERMYALGGSLTLDSKPGSGTTARLTLPLASQTASDESRVTGDKSNTSQEPSTASDHWSPVARHASRHEQHPIRVLLVDDHAMVREGLRTLLNGYPEIEVVGEAGNGEEGVAQARHLNPQVVIMDVNMPRMDGIEATKRITAALPGTIVIGLSVNASAPVLEAMKRAGASTLLTKESAAESLYYTIRSVAPEAVPMPDPQEPLPFSSAES